MPNLTFTAKNLRDIASGPLYWDDRKTGLGARRGADGVVTFLVQYRLGTGQDAQKRRKNIGKWTGDKAGLSIDDARQRAVQIVADARTGVDAFDVNRAADQADPHTVAWALDKHLRRLREDGRSKSYVDMVAWAFDKHILPSIGHKPIAEITRRDLTRVLDDIEAPVMRNRCGTYITGLFNRALKQAWIDANPAGNFDRAKETPKKRFLSHDEIKWLWKATGALEKQGDLGAYFRFVLLTGARLGTASTMEWKELGETVFTLEEDGVIAQDVVVWTVPALSAGRETKTDEPYDIFLSDLAVAQLPERDPQGDDDRVFHGQRGGAIYVKSNQTRDLAKVHAKMEEIAGQEIEHWTIHALRHTLVTWMAKQRAISDKARQAVVNHKSNDINSRYNHHDYRAEKREAMILWANHIARLVGEKEQMIEQIEGDGIESKRPPLPEAAA